MTAERADVPGTPVPPSAISRDSEDALALRRRVVAAIGDSYELGEEIGRGGMAVVYAAQDIRLRRRVALKVLPPDMAFRGDVRTRFVREAQTAARLNHPHIVPIYAVDERDGMVYFAMALVEGESLADLIKREQRPSFQFIGRMLEQVADALAYAHACGVVHRDVKPDNVLLDRESGRAVVTDFGIARAAESGARLTQTGIAVGTPAFMSPEQATGEREVDGRSDVYSLGVVGYLMLAGRLPFEASNTPAMLIKHVTELPPPVSSIRPDAPRALVRVLQRCLEKRPADRFESAAEMRDAVRAAMRDLESNAQSMQDPLRAGRELSRGPQQHQPVRGAELNYPHPDAHDSPRGSAHSPYLSRGGRAEDWSPRSSQHNGPHGSPQHAGAQGQANPQSPAQWQPQMPSADATSGEFKAWRRAVRAQRKEAERREKFERKQARDVAQWGPAAPEQVVEQQLHRFQGKMLRNVSLMVGLSIINLATQGFPWAVFPVVGMSIGLISDYVRLRDHGIRWRDIFGSGSPKGRAKLVATDGQSKPVRIERHVMALRKRAKWFAGSAVAFASIGTIGAGFGLDFLIPPFVASGVIGMAAMQLSLVSTVRLRRLGITIRDAFGDGWKAKAAVSDDRPREMRLAEIIGRVASESVMRSRYADLMRAAADDRLTITDASSRLSDADKSLVPDVAPTADALLERIGAAATALERLELDLPHGALSDLEQRIAATEAERTDAADRERRLSLLQRQRASLEELEARRTTLKRQIDNASMALRSLRLDMVKLRTLGVGAAIADVTNATQEARALSADIGRALEVADEVRRI